MSFPTPDKFSLVVAATTPDGDADFIEVAGPATMQIPDAVNGAWYWEVAGGHSLENFGGVPKGVNIAGPNGSTFGVMCFPARSAGKLDLAASDAGGVEHGAVDDPSMHTTRSIDYEVILSGKVDIELPGGKVRTLEPGSLLVMAGVPHAWKNHYDEDCVYIAVTVGFNS